MNLNTLKKFAQGARRKLLSEVASRLDYVLGHDDAYVRSHQGEIGEIRRQLERKSREQLVEEVAYTWFNRIVALRYMDVRGYHKVRIVSPQAGQVQPELLFQIKQGRTPPEIRSLQTVFDGYLSGTLGSDQPDREIYTAALLGICNDYSRTLPFLFRKVDEYMVALLPTDLLSESSILAAVQGAIGEDDVQDVEVIGWLYQFYISEKKDQVFGRPKGEKIKKEDIPAATQLFTPHWIVRYMVENSLGRLWRNNRPDTGLSEQMEYYIEGDPEPEHLTIEGPEEITLLDPACGSGHILTYAFDLLYGMYEETGYSAEEIPSLILTNNLYGIDIDTRAAELASFALTMKAREKDRFFFKRGVVPRVVAMEDVSVDLREAEIRMSPQLQEAFGYLSEATNFGSLIPVPAEVQGEIEDLLAELDARGDADLFADQAMREVRSGLRQLGYLARRYQCVVTNPPYMSTSNANPRLKDLVKKEYEEGKADLYGSFVIAILRIVIEKGFVALMTPFTWMALSSFTELRYHVLDRSRIIGVIQPEYHAFFDSAFVPICTFVVQRAGDRDIPGVYIDLGEFYGRDVQPIKALEALTDPACRWRTDALQIDFEKIPNQPIAFTIPERLREAFARGFLLKEIAEPRQGIATANNDRYLRFWHEVSTSNIRFSQGQNSSKMNSHRWFPYQKGGAFRRWYGNHSFIVDWKEDGRELRDDPKSVIRNASYFLKEGMTWTSLTVSSFNGRYCPEGFLFDSKGPVLFTKTPDDLFVTMALLNSSVATAFLRVLAPTMDFSQGPVGNIPVTKDFIFLKDKVDPLVSRAIEIAKLDWDSRETSWDFRSSPLLDKGLDANVLRDPIGSDRLLSECYSTYCKSGLNLFTELQELEEENNRVFVELYGLGQDISPDVPWSEISILQEEFHGRESENQSPGFRIKEIMEQFVSFGVGCIFGRYSLDNDGLILANAGDDLDAYLARIPEPTLRPDESGILPITDDNDFVDDLPSQWRAFLRAAFSDEHYEENIRFLEDGLGKRLRQYFLKGFYDDHVKRYKKRPIYWLITSPNGTLQALIYLHRYNRDTVNRFLNDYLRPYQQKLEAKRASAEHVLTGGGSSQSEKTKAQKRIDEIRKALEELSTWERDVVRPLAEKRIELDLDDGVKVNYAKLEAILAKVKGLNA